VTILSRFVKRHSPAARRAERFALTRLAPSPPICGGFPEPLVTEPSVEIGERPCDNQEMTKAELHELVDRLPDGAVDGAAVLLGEISAGRVPATSARRALFRVRRSRPPAPPSAPGLRAEQFRP
jgi:hypothetical protein